MEYENIFKGADKFVRHLLHQYFPKSDGTDTDILTLVFLQKLEYNKIRNLSLQNDKIYKGWKNFLNDLPFSSTELVLRPEEKYSYLIFPIFFISYLCVTNDIRTIQLFSFIFEYRFWRWKMYKKYILKQRTDFRKKMKVGPHFDQLGRFPVTGEDMRLYR
ncbi:PREDICTED: uncharacterized protein LOC105361667 [Ceratosolen solmsi marchali]|uniref:Uncharacterized protein LOC105361667 n=1 Tax=Ceratosolen solmsi marchali TaxID=326594 RepID=A0AAJ7DUT9_9HYME|nr:PREDICTED: uncharacterized protein LOC105361667 [Ceratosolen solmsi marchali]